MMDATNSKVFFSSARVEGIFANFIYAPGPLLEGG